MDNPPPAPSAAYARSRLDRLRNWQSNDFWAMVFARPLAILLLWPIADARWVTPNRLTHLSNLVLLAGVGAIPGWVPGGPWAAVALLNLSFVIDNMDGTLARYRDGGSSLGSYYDKVSDAWGFLLLFAAAGWQAFRETGDARLPLLAMAGAYGLLLTGYMKWVDVAEWQKAEHVRALLEQKPGQVLSTLVRPAAGPLPPRRTPIAWGAWLGKAIVSLAYMNEVDIYFWISVALAVGRLDLYCWWSALSQLALAVGLAIYRARRMHKLDRERPDLLRRIDARDDVIP